MPQFVAYLVALVAGVRHGGAGVNYLAGERTLITDAPRTIEAVERGWAGS